MNHEGTKGTKDVKEIFDEIEPGVEKLAAEVVDSAYKIHKVFGPGLLESAYEACLIHELKRRGIKVESQVLLPLEYEGAKIDAGFRLDLLVGGRLIVELKAVEKVLPVHEAQVITYLKIKKERLGLLINFNAELIKHGIQRVIL